MTARMRIERRLVNVRVVDLAPGLTVDAALVEGLCEVDGRTEAMIINDARLRERLLAEGFITVRGLESCLATSKLCAIARELDLF